MTAVRIAHTADLTRADRTRIRKLMDLAFGDRFDDHDWEHGLGGLHFLVTDGDDPVAHAAVVQRRLLHDGRALRGGYVEAVAVRPDRQRQGLASAVMAAAERVIDDAYDLGALSASAGARALYLGRGWQPWRGETWAMSPAGLIRTAEEDESTLVRTVAGVDLSSTGVLACDWRDGDVW